MILLIETSVKTCSVALANEGVCCAYRESTSLYFQHAELINRFIEEVLVEANIVPADLLAIAVSGGPGSYTGLRIGTSTAKGLCYALEIPLISVDTLLGMTSAFLERNSNLKDDTSIVLYPMIDARRLEVFTQKYSINSKKLSDVYPLILDATTFNNETDVVILFGDGADKLLEKVEFENSNVKIVSNFRPTAKGLIQHAVSKFKAKDFVDLAYFEPNYLKEFKVG